MAKEYNLSDEQYNKILDAMFTCFVNVTGLEYFDLSEDAEVNGRDTLNSMIKNFEKRNKHKEVAVIRNLLDPELIGGIKKEDYIETGKYINEMFNKKRLE